MSAFLKLQLALWAGGLSGCCGTVVDVGALEPCEPGSLQVSLGSGDTSFVPAGDAPVQVWQDARGGHFVLLGIRARCVGNADAVASVQGAGDFSRACFDSYSDAAPPAVALHPVPELDAFEALRIRLDFVERAVDPKHPSSPCQPVQDLLGQEALVLGSATTNEGAAAGEAEAWLTLSETIAPAP